MKKLFILIPMLLISSCKVSGSLQGLFGYQNKVFKEIPDSFDFTAQNSCNDQLGNSQIVVTNGINLSNCIKDQSASLVYMWKPNCTTESCIDPNVVQTICDKKNVSLFVVAAYYDTQRMSKNYKLSRSIYGIDCKYYKSNLTDKYVSKFLEDLLNNSETKEPFLLFEDGQFIKGLRSLNNL